MLCHWHIQSDRANDLIAADLGMSTLHQGVCHYARTVLAGLIKLDLKAAGSSTPSGTAVQQASCNDGV